MVVTLVAATVSATGMSPQPGSWNSGESLSLNRRLATAAEVDGIIYVFGGSPLREALDTVEAYDPMTRTWSARAPMPTARIWAYAAVVDDKIYVLGGFFDFEDYVATGAVEVYDPASDTWETGTSMPEVNWGGAVAAVDESIYVFGGIVGDPFTDHPVYSTVQIYHPATDSWSMGADMPTARGKNSAAAIDGTVYVVSGQTDGGDLVGWITPVVEAYEPASDTWREVRPVQRAREGLVTAVVDGLLYAFGGFSWNETHTGVEVVAEVEVYDPLSDVWRTATRMPNPRSGMAAAVVDGTAYLVGGLKDMFSPGLRAVDSYEPDLYTVWTEIAAHLAGAHGSTWRTDVSLANPSDELANVEFVLHTEAEDFSHIDQVGPGEQHSVVDIVGAMGVAGKGSLEIRSDQPVRATGRTYSLDGAGSHGQAAEFRTLDDGFTSGDTVWLVGLRQEEGLFRTNLSLANTGIRQAPVMVTLFSQSGDELCGFMAFVEPGQVEQHNEVLADECADAYEGWGYATALISGAGVRISASVIDSMTNDATTIVAVR